MINYKILNGVFDKFLIFGSEIFRDFGIKRGIRKLPQSFFLVKVGPPNNYRAAFVGRFDNYVVAFTKIFKRRPLFRGKVGKFSVAIEFKFVNVVTAFFGIVNTSKISGPKRSVKITDRFTCTSANVIYCITCTLCNKLYIGETGRRLGDRFREHLRDVEKNDKDASKPVARHFNLPNHSIKHMAICGLSLHLGTTESRKNLEQKFIFQIGTVNPHGINERFSFN